MVKKLKRVWIHRNRRIEFARCELKLMLLKSVKLNKNIKNKNRTYAYSKVILTPRRYKFTRYTQTCTISGKSKGVWSFCNLNRHKLNELNRNGSLLNVKPTSW